MTNKDWENAKTLVMGNDVMGQYSNFGGFNRRVFGDLNVNDEPNAYPAFKLACDLIEQGRIYYTHRFPCPQCGNMRFEYGGKWACHECQNSINTPDWWIVKVRKDGDQWQVVGKDFESIMESENYAFGKTKEMALENYCQKYQPKEGAVQV
jgi:uncharacterized Zn finger protein (UPF0148 family)